jgi:uncharacterized damage-inducible protein DinB
MALAAVGVCGAQAQMGGQTAAPAKATLVSPAKTFEAQLSSFEREFMGVARAMPADKYDFAPSQAIFAASQKTDYRSPNNKGVRTFAETLKHVAQANYFFASRLSGLKPDVDVEAIGSLKDKEHILAALEGSFAFAHKAIATLTPENAFESVRGDQTRASLAGAIVSHGFDHFGHLAEYLRMNGLIPPSSQR